MRLLLKNIGKIGSTSIEINGITVIAGENNTGKSTVGRALFAVFNSFFDIQKQLLNERIASVERILERGYYGDTMLIDARDLAKEIVFKREKYKIDEIALSSVILEFLRQYGEVDEDDDEERIGELDESDIEESVVRIKEVLNVSDKALLYSLIADNLNSEFNGQVCNVFTEDAGEITLGIKQQNISVVLEGKGVVRAEYPENLSLHTEVIYMDDPYVLDDSRRYSRSYSLGYSDHRYHLHNKFFARNREGNLVNEIIAKDKFEKIYDMIDAVCDGDVMRNNKRFEFGYRKQGSDKVIHVRNLSTGLKTFLILKMLLIKGAIEQNGTIILDEPEIHLHPEWQLLFAELIVLIQKEFGIHVLLNTHSPYFLNAIEVYAAKYDVADKCKYYLATSTNDISSITDVTDNIEVIYSTLAKPLQDLENERGRL